MHRVQLFCLFAAATSGLCHCARHTSNPGSNGPAQSVTAAGYVLTQHSASHLDRMPCAEHHGCGEPMATSEVRQVPGRCDVELCEGDLSSADVADLRATAARTRECYERELEANRELEGKVMAHLRLAHGREPCEVRLEINSLKVSESFVKCVVERLRETRARPSSGCIDLALPLALVRQEVDPIPDGGVPNSPPLKQQLTPGR
jgi:hypothetical protein